MSNYVSKKNAIGLKEIGFDLEVNAGHCIISNEIPELFVRTPVNYNEIDTRASMPDFLTASDWLAEKHNIVVSFATPKDTIVCETNSENDKDFTGTNHRNAAIAYAIQIVKARNGRRKR